MNLRYFEDASPRVFKVCQRVPCLKIPYGLYLLFRFLNLREAQEWFKEKFGNLQAELARSRYGLLIPNKIVCAVFKPFQPTTVHKIINT